MSGIYNITVTTAGAALLSRAAAGEELVFTRGQFGSGIVTGSYTARTALNSPVCYTSLDAATAADGVLSVPLLFSNKSGDSFLSAFTINEIGLFGKVGSGSETLIAYANAGSAGNGIAIPGDTLTELSYVFKIAYSGTANVTVSASSITYVQKEYVDAQLTGKANTSHTHVTSDITDLQTALDAKAAKSHTHTASEVSELTTVYSMTLTAANWSGDLYTISNTALTANAQLIIGLSESATKDQYEACAYALIRVTSQKTGSITLTADGGAPTVNLPIVIRKIG